MELLPTARVIIQGGLTVMLTAAEALDLDPEDPGPDLDSPAMMLDTLVYLASDPDTPRQEAREYVKVLRDLLECKAIVLAPESDALAFEGESIVVTLPAAMVLYGPRSGPVPFRRCAWTGEDGEECPLPARGRAGARGPRPRWCDEHTKARKDWLRVHGQARPQYKPCCVAWQLDSDPSHTGKCPQCSVKRLSYRRSGKRFSIG